MRSAEIRLGFVWYALRLVLTHCPERCYCLYWGNHCGAVRLIHQSVTCVYYINLLQRW